MSLSLFSQLPAFFAFPLGTACRLSLKRRDFSLFARKRSLRVERIRCVLLLSSSHRVLFFFPEVCCYITFSLFTLYSLIDSTSIYSLALRSRLTRSFDDSFRALSQSIARAILWSIPWRDDPLSSHAEDAGFTSHDRPVTTVNRLVM